MKKLISVAWCLSIFCNLNATDCKLLPFLESSKDGVTIRILLPDHRFEVVDCTVKPSGRAELRLRNISSETLRGALVVPAICYNETANSVSLSGFAAIDWWWEPGSIEVFKSIGPAWQAYTLLGVIQGDAAPQFTSIMGSLYERYLDSIEKKEFRARVTKGTSVSR